MRVAFWTSAYDAKAVAHLGTQRRAMQFALRPTTTGRGFSLTRSIRNEHLDSLLVRGAKPMCVRIQIVTLSSILLAAAAPLSSAADEANTCSLLTPAQVAAALGEPVADGKQVVTRMCEWKIASGKKSVLLTVFGQMGRSSPVERFMNSKKEVAGITKTPASGIGDDAIFIPGMGGGLSLNVRSKNSAFQIHVGGPGVSEDQARRTAETLARQVVLKL